MPNIRRGMMGAAGVSAEPATQFPIYGWGQNDNGGLGDGTTVNKSNPVQMGDKSDWVQWMAAGNGGGGAINAAGELWTWGLNDKGQLGLGDTTNRSSPTQVGSLTNWSTVSIVTTHMLAVKTDGTLWAAGNNARGQLGDGSTTDRSSPVQIGSLTDWSKLKTRLAGDQDGSHAIKSDGTLWSWGYQDNGMLGNGVASSASISSPIQIGSDTDWEVIRSGGKASLCIRNGDEYWAFGSQQALGNNDTANRSSPVQIAGSWLHVATCQNNSSIGIKTGGTLWTWGNGYWGSLMNGATAATSSPGQIGSTTDWSKVAGSQGNQYAVKTDGTLWIAGQGYEGKIGDGTTVSKSSPVQIGSDTDWLDVGQGGTRSASATKVV